MKEKITFEYKREKKQNPYIGFTSFQHFNNGPLYSDLVVRPENNLTETEHVECFPIPDYVEENGRDEGYYPDSSTAYFRCLWKEFEPKEGVFRYDLIEDILNRARENGQTLMFRLMQHSTRETDDVPDWLKKKIDCPARPAGMRVKTSPSDPRFLTYFGRAVRALGERFDSDPTLALVDISLPGAWGEGSDLALFSEEDLTKFIDIYSDVFKNTLLIGQTSVASHIIRLSEKTSVGWRADCIGHPGLTFERLPAKVEEVKNVWKTGHVSFESYWWLGEWQRQGWDPDRVFATLLDWHVSTFNAKSLPIPNEWRDKVDSFVDKMGYHFVIDSVEITLSTDTLDVTLLVDNVGAAPIYHKLPLTLRLVGEKEFSFDTAVDIRSWLPGKHTEDISVLLPTTLPKGEYLVEIGIGGGDTPSAVFATTAQDDGDFSVVGKITVED